MHLVLGLLVTLSLVACKKDEPKPEPPKAEPVKPAAEPAKPATGDGPRKVAIEASREGYVPDKISGKPGEALTLVVTRRASGGECMAELKSPDGKLHQLPVDKPYEIAVTVPKDGEVRFACGMDMFVGKIVAEKS